jgi:hypothetical protein
MAVGQVSSISGDNWQLISTFTVSSSANTQAVATSISGYKSLILVVNGYTASTTDTWGIYFNGDQTTGNYGSAVWGGGTGSSSDNQIILSYYTTTAPGTGYVKIMDAGNATIPKTTFSSGAERWGEGYGIWNNTAAITSITARHASGNITAGTFKLYGLAG